MIEQLLKNHARRFEGKSVFGWTAKQIIDICIMKWF